MRSDLAAVQIVAGADGIITHVAIGIFENDVEVFLEVEITKASEHLNGPVLAKEIDFGVVQVPVPGKSLHRRY